MNSDPENTGNGSGMPDSTSPSANTYPPTKRRRSSHHHHRQNAKKLSSSEKEKQTRRKMDLKIIMFAVPSLLLLVGGILWVISNINPDASMRPKGLIRLSYYMLIIGGLFFVLALLIDWARKLRKFMKEKREKESENDDKTRRRSSHRRHRHNHEE